MLRKFKIQEQFPTWWTVVTWVHTRRAWKFCTLSQCIALYISSTWPVPKSYPFVINWILGCNSKRYTLRPSEICWPSMVKPRWRTPDYHLSSFKVRIRTESADLHAENFSTLSPWSLCSVFPLSPHKNLCLHWGVKMVFGTRVPHLLRPPALE